MLDGLMKYVERYSNRATETSFTFEEDSRTLKKLNGILPEFPIRKTGSERKKT